ncbi:MAG: VacJ family lipoprotein [Lentisphaeria bacterium]|nr:VacJ family lipoprotein [Lentisphaeria bacterium]
MRAFFIRSFLLLITILVVSGCHHPYDRYPEEHPEAWTLSDVEIMLGGEDPMEGFNRAMFGCTDFLMTYGADPLARVYTSIFPRPFIKHFHNVCVNLEYPGRAVSSLLQAQWQAAGTETVRFLANSTLGIAGIFDVAQAWWYIPPAEADFGQAFNTWGIGPGHTFMLPLVPSLNGRDHIGLLFDTAFDIKTYIPYAGYATFLNRMTVAQDGYAGIVDSAADPYKNYRQLMLVRRELQLRMWFYKEAMRQLDEYKKQAEAEGNKKGTVESPVKWSAAGKPEFLRFGNYVPLDNFFARSGETDSLRVMFFNVQKDRDWWYMPLSIFNSDFLREGYRRKVELVPERPGLRYCFWKAPEVPENSPPRPEKLAIMLSGIGGTLNNSTLVALSEQFNNAGFMVLTLDSTFNWNFIVADGNCRLPGYLPDDAKRVREAIVAVLADLKKREWINAPEIVICGYSMGGIQTLKLAEMEEKDPVLNPSCFIAVNPPVSLGSALRKIDSLVAGSAGWSKSEMREKLISVAGNMLLKLMPHYLHVDENTPVEKFREFIPPVDEETAKVVAGMFLKLSMREMLFTAHRENPFEGFPAYEWGSRMELYKELDKVSFEDYAYKLLTPCYPGESTEKLLADSHLRSIEDTLRNSPKIRVFHNVDDFLCSDEERIWLDEVLKDKVTWFSNGGHLGNLYYKVVLQQIVNAAGK